MRPSFTLLSKIVPTKVTPPKFEWSRPGKRKKKWFNWEPIDLKEKFYYMMTEDSTKLYIRAGLIFVGGLMLWTFHYAYYQYKIRSSEYSMLALKKIHDTKQLVEILGSPLEPGYIVTKGDNGITDTTADVILPIYGRKTRGVLMYYAYKTEEGPWKFKRMEFKFLDQRGGVIRLVNDLVDDES